MSYTIKNLKPNPNSKYKQGYFGGQDGSGLSDKYVGPKPVIYRSSLELKFIQRLESNPNIIKWSSENFKIPYQIREYKNGKYVMVTHNYNVDFTVWLSNGNKYVIEVKPSSLTPLNESQIKRNPVMYKNACKWQAAIKWCKENGFSFRVVTEKDLVGPVFS